MKERSARRAAPREGERSQVAEVLNICIVDPSTIWRHTAREILCRELDANGVRVCVDEFYAPESMTSDGGCAYYDVVLADISDRQTREQYLRFFRDLRLTSPQTKLIFLSADPLAALDVFECDPDYFVCKLEMETRLSAALHFVLRPCGGELGPCLIVGSRATRHVLSMREILYCEHAQRQTKIVMTTRTVTCSEKLNEIYGRLDPAQPRQLCPRPPGAGAAPFARARGRAATFYAVRALTPPRRILPGDLCGRSFARNGFVITDETW